jgi:hypothetical protein
VVRLLMSSAAKNDLKGYAKIYFLLEGHSPHDLQLIVSFTLYTVCTGVKMQSFLIFVDYNPCTLWKYISRFHDFDEAAASINLYCTVLLVFGMTHLVLQACCPAINCWLRQ